MKKPLSYLLFPLAMLALVSCFGEEPLNAEADIERVTLSVDDPTEVFYNDFDTWQDVSSSASAVVFTCRKRATVTSIPVSLTLTAGAVAYTWDEAEGWVLFVDGTLVDFSDERKAQFRVVSEDGLWSREYTVQIVHDQSSVGELTLSFTFDNNYALNDSTKTVDDKGCYYIWTETDEAIVTELFAGDSWKSGNPGFKLSTSSAKPTAYPTVPEVGGGPDGSDCVVMETKSTGSFGKMAGMLIAAGSIFNGEFDVANALKDARKATRFGTPFKHKPMEVTFWAKWQEGDYYQDKSGNKVDDVCDEPDVYVVFYRNQDEDGDQVMLDGDDVLSSPYIIGLARLPHNYAADGSDLVGNTPIHGLTSEWQEVTLTVEYTSEVDATLLENNGYSIVIGCASSWQGAYFTGSVGSKLWVDNITITCE